MHLPLCLTPCPRFELLVGECSEGDSVQRFCIATVYCQYIIIYSWYIRIPSDSTLESSLSSPQSADTGKQMYVYTNDFHSLQN